jgi:predicted neuraminidase
VPCFYHYGSSPGKFIVAWFGGSHEGKNDVSIWTSVDNGRSWSTAVRLPEGVLGPVKNKPVELADGTILSPSSTEESSGRWKVHIERSADAGKTWKSIPVDHTTELDVIQPSILSYPGGKLQILCRSKQGNVVHAWSDDGGMTWGKLTKTELLNPNSGTDAVTLKNGKQLIVYNPDVPGKDWFNGRGKLRVAASLDGQTWKDIAVLEDGNKEEFSYPAIIEGSDGLVHITYTYDRRNIKHAVLKQEN